MSRKKYIALSVIVITLLVTFSVFRACAEMQPGKAVDEERKIFFFESENIPEKTILANSAKGSGIYNLEGVQLGNVEDILLEPSSGKIVLVFMKSGGFMGFGEKIFAVSWNSLTYSPENGNFYLDTDRQDLSSVPSLEMNRFKAIYGRGTRDAAKSFYAPGFEGKGYGYREYGYGYEFYPQAGTGNLDTLQNLFNPDSIERFTGEIMKIERSVPEAGLLPQVQIKLTVFTENNEIREVYLGPQWFIVEPDRIYPFKTGDRIEVTGSLAATRDKKEFIIATEVIKGDDLLRLRSSEGVPLWTGWRNDKE